MSIRAYARARHTDAKTLRRHVASGLIVLDAQGQIDERQADAAWGPTRRGSRLGRYQDGQAGVESAEAKVALTRAKLQLIRQRYDTMSERYVDRAEAVRVGAAEARYVLDALRAAPDGPDAEPFAAALEIDVETARRILRAFIDRALAEIGDLEKQAIRDAERA
jgi:hypothetical protein